MSDNEFNRVYLKLKLQFYGSVFKCFETREASLTAVEIFCTEIIHALGNPTINEFARFANVTPQNATHKINSLLNKDYICKVQSQEDKREYQIAVTDKFFKYYDISEKYIKRAIARLGEIAPREDLAAFERVLKTLDEEVMSDVRLGI